MTKKLNQQICRRLEERLTDREFLKAIGLKRKVMVDFLKAEEWSGGAAHILGKKQVLCADVLEYCRGLLGAVSPREPQEGWLLYTYRYICVVLFPDSMELVKKEEYRRGALIFLQVLRIFLEQEEPINGGQPQYGFRFLSQEELSQSDFQEEYLQFQRCFREQYVYELMRIGCEAMPFNTLGHVCGVHNIAMHVARQLRQAGVPIDLGLASAAAASHDIGKYGCKPNESQRIPYLHYYYTDEWLQKHGMAAVSHIASNHSTWDLELENLPVEALVLIYSDFRVKNRGMKDGKEVIAVFTLQEAFSVILNKLDNVDEVKERRYRHVYAKLADFENYMVSLGVNVDLTKETLSPVEYLDGVLLSQKEAVERLKHMAISHNIRLMSRMAGEASFGNVLEAARSEKNWKNSRAYINLFEEYFTYMTQKQKMMTLKFLYELLMHREGDIRRQAADLLGNIIVHFDEEYRKELPEGVVAVTGEMTGLLLWDRYLHLILHPDHKVAEQHRRWMGYALKIAVDSVLSRCALSERSAYLACLLKQYEVTPGADSAAFTLIDTALAIPPELLLEEDQETLIRFAESIMDREPLEIRTGVLRFMKYFSEYLEPQEGWVEIAEEMLLRAAGEDSVSLHFLAAGIGRNWELSGAEDMKDRYERQVTENPEIVPDIFLDNLKTGTPWITKAVNVELLMEYIAEGHKSHMLHVATHFSNLLKVSERVAVRHSAGQGLLAMVPLLSRDQRNEVAIELMKGLETGEYEFSKYIPQYLGEFALYLHPMELDEFLREISRLLISTNDRVVCVALDTMGVILQHYSRYEERFTRDREEFLQRRKKLLGMLLSGLANYTPSVRQEAFLVIGQYLFGSDRLTLAEQRDLFSVLYKKIVVLVPEQEGDDLAFFNSAASLNHIYRFISNALFELGEFAMEERSKAAFFPGTFDPFSLSHKEIAKKIRDLGFTVYLALDEFSWSKKTQPRMIRRQIVNMSVANEEDIYLFPDNIPVNIANPMDLKRLGQMFPHKELYIAVGSDVVRNASSYQKEPEPWSIHSVNHVIFQRDGGSSDGAAGNEGAITGKVVRLRLPVPLEDISSTRIRENVDYNRDISNLIDPLAQNYIYENSLYLREPQYKPILQARSIHLSIVKVDAALAGELLALFTPHSHYLAGIKALLAKPKMRAAVLRDGRRSDRIAGVLLYRGIRTTELYREFRDTAVVNHIRENTSGKMMLIDGVFVFGETEIGDRIQLLFTEALADCLKDDYTYAIYGSGIMPPGEQLGELLLRQGFLRVPASCGERPVYAADMKSPIVVFKDIETTVKEPFSSSPAVLQVINRCHRRLQESLAQLYPGNLVLSINSSVLHHQLMKLITVANGVPAEPLPVRSLGPSMCVPFGKILRGIAVPNTVTKTLHTEKTFDPSISSFRIMEYPNYSPLENQIRTIKSFQRKVILVDDLIHKGYRIRELSPLFRQEGVEIDRIISGVLSGRGKDLMDIQKRRAESVYFLPNLRLWVKESAMYPFIGGDSVQCRQKPRANLLNAVNLVLPYCMPAFFVGASRGQVSSLSLTCLENARDILSVLEEDYQESFERKLTLSRLSEAVISPSCPDRGSCLSYDYHLAASVYVENDIEMLKRLEKGNINL